MYAKKFQSSAAKGNKVAATGLLIINQVSTALSQKTINIHELYPLFKYRYILGFSSFHIDKDNIASYLVLNDFIRNICSHSQEHKKNTSLFELLTFIHDYQKNSLIISIDNYKSDILLIKDQKSVKQELLLLISTLKELTEFEIAHQRTINTKEKLDKNFKQQSSSYEFLKKPEAEQAKNFLAHNISGFITNDEFQFLERLQETINKPKLTYKDIASLKQSSNKFKKAILQLPSVQEIKCYHWLINLFCNILNKFIYCIESEKSKEIKQQFSHWQQWITVSEEAVKHVDKQIPVQR